ncbi:hypothetical protein Leryth_024661 [Lithospermum erythrorhizon]|nr:hypothetical protein Leryth_024661 [Lithospermum erythrorhizon]
MSFTGTLDKCKACDKTVYFNDLLSADGTIYHKACFKCSHCKGTLVMSNYSSMDGVVYCKPHFEQLFKESGNFSKNFQTGSKPEREMSMVRNHRANSLKTFSGTQRLKMCRLNKTINIHLRSSVQLRVTMEGESFHKSCFKCAHGGCPLTHSSYAALDGILYCKHHFQQLFMVKGNYQHVLNSATHKKNASADAEAMADTLAGKSDTEAATAAPEEKTLDAENGPEEKKAEE